MLEESGEVPSKMSGKIIFHLTMLYSKYHLKEQNKAMSEVRTVTS